MIIAAPSQTKQTGPGAGRPGGVTVVSQAITSTVRRRSIRSVSSNAMLRIFPREAARGRFPEMEGTTFFSVLERHAEADPDRPALTSGEVTLTRAQFVDRVTRRAALFAWPGVTEGSTVTIGLPNSVGLVESMFAAWALGAVPQPISGRLPPLERSAILELADPALAVGVPAEETGGRPTLQSIPGELPAGEFTPGVTPEWKLV